MPKVSKESAAQVDDHGPVEDRHEDVDGYTVNFVTFRAGHRRDAAAEGAAGRQLPVPALGLRPQGTVTFRFADHDEVFEAGDAFYLPPGHIPIADAGSEIVQFSPAEELQRSRRR